MAKVEPRAAAPAPAAGTVQVRSLASVPPVQCVVLGRVTFALVWACLFSLHVICAWYFISAGLVYSALPATQGANMLLLYQLTIDPSSFKTIAVFHYAVAAVHAYLCLKTLCWKVYSTVVPSSARGRLSSAQLRLSKRLSDSAITSRTASTVIVVHSKLSRFSRRVYRLFLARDGLFGVQNQHFELLFLLREVLETGLQSYQGYNMSRLLPDMRLNRFYTIILILNCFTTPLLRRIFSKKPALQRLLVVVCDIVLDFVSSIGVPVIVAAEYWAHYDPETTDFSPWTLWYGDLWLLKFMNEAPLVLFGNWLDAASRLVFSLGLLSSIEDVKSLVHLQGVANPRASSTTSFVRSRKRKSSATAMLLSASPPSRQASAIAVMLRNPANHEKLSRFVHRLLVLWGIFIAGVFLAAQLRESAVDCDLELRPWLVTKPACGIVKLNCNTRPDFAGEEAQVHEILDSLDAGSVEHIIFQHCPNIEIPTLFGRFRNLYGFKSYNSTIASWSTEAAFTAEAHPRVRFAFFVKTNFTNGELPSGLVHSNFPPTLGDIEICISNLQKLPEVLPWPLTSTIYIEFSHLDAFPLVLSRLKPYTLSLAFNNISEFPVEAIMTPDIAKFTLRGNPITKLPETGVDISQLHDTGTGVSLARISVERTNISSLPLWITEQFLQQVEFRAGNSPICTQILEQTESNERQMLLSERPWLSQIDCQDRGRASNYPIEVDEG